MRILVPLLLVAGLWQVHALAEEKSPPPAAATPAPATPAPAATTPAADAAKAEADREREKYWEERRQNVLHAKWNVCVDLQMVALEEAKALDLIPDLQSGESAKVEEAWKRLQAMIKAKEAILLGWPMVRGADGDRSVAESIVEQRYPTEYASPAPLKPGVNVPAVPGLVADKSVIEDAIPTAFETRNLGVTLEVEANVVDDGKRVHLSVVPQRVELLEMQKNVSKMGDGRGFQEAQPIFATSKTTQEFTLQNGERSLIGVHKMVKPAGYIELHLVKVMATKVQP